MKKSNWIILAVLVVISAFLLWLWYFLQFNKIDNPLDLVLSIVWWVVVAAALGAITYAEKKRQERVRTLYVSGAKVFNSEKGFVDIPQGKKTIDTLEELLEGLEYNFHNEDCSDSEMKSFKYVVRSKKFKSHDSDWDDDEESRQESNPEWEGELAIVARPDDDPLQFSSREELEQLLATAAIAAA